MSNQQKKRQKKRTLRQQAFLAVGGRRIQRHIDVLTDQNKTKEAHELTLALDIKIKTWITNHGHKTQNDIKKEHSEYHKGHQLAVFLCFVGGVGVIAVGIYLLQLINTKTLY